MKKSTKTRFCRAKAGFTLVELMVAIALGSVVLGGATFSINMWARSAIGLGNYADMSGRCRRALDIFASDVRMADDVFVSTADTFTFEAFGPGSGTVMVSYAFDSTTGDLIRTYDGASTVLLDDVAKFTFLYYNIKDRVNPTVNPLEVKEVQIGAVLAKKVIRLSNTDEIISARFMLRNRLVSK